jgi:hypothetical protein
MKTLLQAIGDIVRPELRQDGVIRLEETDPGSTCKPVTLNKSGPALVLKLDSLPPPACAAPGCQLRYSVNDRLFPLFRTDTGGLTALCDYLVFYPERTESTSRLFVFLCELKSANLGTAKKQAENGRLLADYIVAMARHHHRLAELPKLEMRGLVFSPSLELPKIGNPARDRCSYRSFAGRMPDMKLAYCRDGASYPLAYFCT